MCEYSTQVMNLKETQAAPVIDFLETELLEKQKQLDAFEDEVKSLRCTIRDLKEKYQPHNISQQL